MYEVKCPICKKIREVKSKQPWMTNLPYEKLCKKCCQVGKVKTEEHKNKLSIYLKKAQTTELLAKKSEFMKKHPELWVEPHPELGQQAWRGKHHTEETKEKISKSVLKTIKRKK